jgi:hypothetical protein
LTQRSSQPDGRRKHAQGDAMSRKKHTHQTKAEAHADEVVLAENAADGESKETAQDKASDPFQRATIEAQGRIQKLIKSAEELAKTRLSGTRMELLMDGLPARLEKAFDAALDRVGLVRKSKLPGAAQAEPSSAAAEPAPAQ